MMDLYRRHYEKRDKSLEAFWMEKARDGCCLTHFSQHGRKNQERYLLIALLHWWACIVEIHNRHSISGNLFCQACFARLRLLILYMQFLCPGDHWRWSSGLLPIDFEGVLVLLARNNHLGMLPRWLPSRKTCLKGFLALFITLLWRKAASPVYVTTDAYVVTTATQADRWVMMSGLKNTIHK